jgi:D-glycero-alpha-D-manno-heptose-7-phosphate kinase
VLIARAPLRISFAGGGTDLPAYYRRFGGMVISAAIDKYSYVFVSPNGDRSLQVSSANYHALLRHTVPMPIPMDGELRHARAILNELGIVAGYSIFLASEVPPGTGLGSSSAAAVALLKALTALRGEVRAKGDLAELASRMEIEALHMPIGKQDQYASTFGGINAIQFSADGVAVRPLALLPEARSRLQASTMLFLTGLTHESTKILSQQETRTQSGERQVLAALHAIRSSADEARVAIERGDIGALGAIMHRGWECKKQLASGITTPGIDRAYEAARRAGALGGKITGAGGGGFLMLCCEADRQPQVTAALGELGLTKLDFHFDQAGARVLVNNATV